MDEPSYFQSALSSFVTDAACGGAVRHLTDIGYTLDQIVDRLDYPAPRAKVQRIMMDYLYESGVLLKEEPSAKLFAAKEVFVQEQDAFGRRTMRKIVDDSGSQNNASGASDLQIRLEEGRDAQKRAILWKESVYDPKRDGKLTELLHQKCEQNGEIYSYITCPFGVWLNDRNSQDDKNGNDGRNEQSRQGETEKPGGAAVAAEDGLRCLNTRQLDYLQGIRWDQPVLYHRLNQRMLEIIGKLYEAGAYGGACFFVTGQKKLIIPQK